MYLPLAQFPGDGMDIAIRSKTSAIAAGAVAFWVRVRSALR